MAREKGTARNRGKGRGKAMEWEKMAMGGPNRAAREGVAKEKVRTLAFGTALGGKAPTGLGAPEGASSHGDGQHWPPYAMRSNAEPKPTPAKSVPKSKVAATITSSPYPGEGRKQYHRNNSGCHFALGLSIPTCQIISHSAPSERPFSYNSFIQIPFAIPLLPIEHLPVL